MSLVHWWHVQIAWLKLPHFAGYATKSYLKINKQIIIITIYYI